MYEWTVRPKCLHILDSSVIETMARNNVQYIHYSIMLEETGEQIIIARMPDNSEDLTLGKSWLSVHYGRHVWTRTPSILQNHIGQKVIVYTERIFKESHELFRIRSLGFLFGASKIRKRRIKLEVPYFTSSGIVVIPRTYINKYLDNKAPIVRLSFNMVNDMILDHGNIWAHFTAGDEHGSMMYPLYKCTNGLRTRTPVDLINRVANYGKSLSHYQYLTTVKQEGFEYGVMVFEEIKSDAG